ncbi:MAG: NTP transferase domain-containing protein [Candidatus Hydrogenedentes bacterium]|nr:NTP transferase domain-containing protein [Candidatus Hydrogenedentota bacterium]
MKAVIFAAGKSTRTYPLTLTRPKPLLPVANTTILEHQLNALAGLVDGVLVVVGYRKEMIVEHLGDRYRDLSIEYVEQHETLGTGHALLQCADRIDAPFLAMNGDDIFAASDLQAVAALEQGALAQRVEDPRLFGVFDVDDAGYVRRIVEKPDDDRLTLANAGVYKFNPDVFDAIRETAPSPRGEIEITTAIQSLADAGGFRVQEIEGHWLSIGYPWDLITANEFLLEHATPGEILGEVSPAAHVEGLLSLGKGSVIRPGVVIDGPVMIGAGCTIGPNAWLRPGTVIGNNCKVGMSVEIKNSILMEGARIPHLSYVGDSVVGANANLGCGTVTANFRHDGANHRSLVKGELVDTGRRKFGAIIGDDVHTGINTSIYPGRKLWPGTSTLPGAIVNLDVLI